VDPASAKGAVVEAVQSACNVKVTSVNSIRREGKMKRNRRKCGTYDVTPRHKVALVTLQGMGE
jgi:ribosomal protein L23